MQFSHYTILSDYPVIKVIINVMQKRSRNTAHIPETSFEIWEKITAAYSQKIPAPDSSVLAQLYHDSKTVPRLVAHNLNALKIQHEIVF
jgi:hypothetical protein